LHNLKSIRAEEKVAVYEIYKDGNPVDEKEISFDIIHVTPPQSAPDFIKSSPLSNEEGWVRCAQAHSSA
jgi:sulfide:quinone oxidoreductase